MSEHLPPRLDLGLLGLLVAGVFGGIRLVAEVSVATTRRALMLSIANYVLGVLFGGIAAAIWTYPALAPLKTWLANDPWAVAGVIAIFAAPLAGPVVELIRSEIDRRRRKVELLSGGGQ